MMLAVSEATSITAIAAGFFVALALISLTRALWVKHRPPRSRRYRVGVFVERDAQPQEQEQEKESP